MPHGGRVDRTANIHPAKYRGAVHGEPGHGALCCLREEEANHMMILPIEVLVVVCEARAQHCVWLSEGGTRQQ